MRVYLRFVQGEEERSQVMVVVAAVVLPITAHEHIIVVFRAV